MLTFGLVFRAVLFVLGVFWCREMLGRRHRDLEEFRSATSLADRGVVLFWWGVTAVIVVLMLRFAIGLVRGIAGW